MPVIKERWAKLNPPPTRETPILIGGGGKKVTLRIVAEHAHIWHSFGDVAEMADKNTVLNEWCEKVGRDPSDIERSVGIHPHRVEQDLKHADEFYDVGMRQFTIGLNGPHYPLEQVQPWLDWRDEMNATG
jgi:alkanesulfonate monooxygenase SsuD/methylene tetrahydromethanopterin reductase-like flavin-dependent oxidoreductase (luciferase family)